MGCGSQPTRRRDTAAPFTERREGGASSASELNK